MKRILPLCLLTLSLVWTLCPAALAIEPMGASVTAQVCYPTSISRSEDGAQLKKIYDLGPEEDPAGIPRSDFEQDGFHYGDAVCPQFQATRAGRRYRGGRRHSVSVRLHRALYRPSPPF